MYKELYHWIKSNPAPEGVGLPDWLMQSGKIPSLDIWDLCQELQCTFWQASGLHTGKLTTPFRAGGAKSLGLLLEVYPEKLTDFSQIRHCGKTFHRYPTAEFRGVVRNYMEQRVLTDDTLARFFNIKRFTNFLLSDASCLQVVQIGDWVYSEPFTPENVY